MQVPAQIGSFRIVSALGQGGFAVVYAAEDERDGTPVAIKIPHTAAARARAGWFRREASMAARLRHPGIVRLLSSGTLEGPDGPVPYLVFERIDGPTLEAVADELSTDDIVAVGSQLLSALGYAHDAGVLHCDIKPENLLVAGADPGTGAPIVRLADFGLAATHAPSAHDEAGIPIVAGTPGYLSPEQARGVGRLGPSADIYSSGALLFRLLAGFTPHGGGSSTDIVRRTLTHDPLPLEPRAGIDVSPELVAVVETMLRREPARRPASAHRARRALLEAASAERTIVGARADGTADTFPPPASAASSEDAETLAAPSSGREPVATPAVAISRHIGRRAPLLGRDAELERLVTACTVDVRAGDERPVVRVLGAYGAGRTRLVRELVSRVRSWHGRPFVVTGRRGVRSPPFEVLSALALDVIGAAGTNPPWLAAERLTRALSQAGVPREDAGRDALVAGLVGVGLPTAVGTVRLQAYRAFLSLLGLRRDDVLLVVDDADDIDEDSLAVLELLARAPDSEDGRGSPRVVIVLREPIDPADVTVRCVDVELGPLDQGSSTRILAALTDRVPESLEQAAREAYGLPADLTEAAAGVLAPGAEVGPALERRVRALPPRIRAVLAAAAVHDGDAPVRSLASMAAAIAPEIDEQMARAALDRLVLDGVLVRVPNAAAALESVVRFASERVRRRVTAELHDDERTRLHAAAASWIVRESYDGTLGVQAVLARHAEAAGDLATAAHAHASAGRMGVPLARFDASTDLAMALTLARSSPQAARAVDEPGLLADMAQLALQRGEIETAELFALQALELVEDERRTLRARLHRHVAESHVQRRRVDPALAELDAAVALLGSRGDPVELASALALRGWVLAYLAGRNQEGTELGLRARDVAAQIDAPEFRARLNGRLGGILLRAGDWDGQLALNLEDLGLSVSARDVGGVVRAHINLGVCYTNRGLTGLARAHTEHALRLSRRYGHRAAEHIALNNLAMVAADERRLEDAERHARDALELAERSGMRGASAESWCTRARVRLRCADAAGAEEAADQALSVAEGAVDREMATRVRAMAVGARGRSDLAVELLVSIVSGEASDPYERANTRLSLAAAMKAAGRPEEGREQERIADAEYARLGADPAHERTRWQ